MVIVFFSIVNFFLGLYIGYEYHEDKLLKHCNNKTEIVEKTKYENRIYQCSLIRKEPVE